MQTREESWLKLALDGDADAFTHLVEAYQKPVFNLCYRMLGDPAEAEDAAQETFLRAYRSLKRYDNSRPFGTWLLSIAAHYCIDQLRKQRMRMVSVDELAPFQLSDDLPGPESALAVRQERQMVQGLLQDLSPIERAAVVMYYWYDYSYAEIGESLSLTESAVKSRLHRARRQMALKLLNQRNQESFLEKARHGEQSPAY